MPRLILCILLLNAITLAAQTPSPFIHVDQFGYHVDDIKVAVLSDPQIGYNGNQDYTPSAQLDIINVSDQAVVLSVSPQPWNAGALHDQSGDRGWWLDFSALNQAGNYFIRDAATNQQSATFSIDNTCYQDVIKAAGRAFFYNRCNMEKASPYADANWTDVNNFLNPLQDANCRPIDDPTNAALEKELSGGWFDAGDYNKYVTFAHSAVHNLLAAYEENPQAFSDDWNIPESGNGLPDLLDELKWELDWLLKMNNSDGSTHIKMGSRNYQENIEAPPSLCTDQRYYGPTCTAASLAIASMFSHASIIFGQESGYEAFADTLESRAINSWNYVQPFISSNTLETGCDNGSIISGDADWDVSTQLEVAVIASMRLFQLTGDASYHTYFQNNYSTTEQITNAFWAAYLMALNDALLAYTTLPTANNGVATNIINSLTMDASNNWNGYYGFNDADLYRAFMPEWSYHWGSNLPKANYASLNKLLIDHNINSPSHNDYQKYINEAIHYFHGVNPQGLVYLSNMSQYGAERSCNEIYHTWFADGSDWDSAEASPFGPAPGFVPGGPNQNFSVASLTPPSGQPQQKSYLDFNTNFPDNSWEISEPAIYYQAAYIRLLANAVDVNLVSSIGHVQTTNATIEIFPNPTNEFFVIRGDLGNYTIDLLDNLGQVVQNLNTINNEIIVNMNLLGPGLFFVRLEHLVTNELSVQKIIKGN